MVLNNTEFRRKEKFMQSSKPVWQSKFNYRFYRWLWVSGGRLSRWAGKRLIAINHKENDKYVI